MSVEDNAEIKLEMDVCESPRSPNTEDFGSVEFVNNVIEPDEMLAAQKLSTSAAKKDGQHTGCIDAAVLAHSGAAVDNASKQTASEISVKQKKIARKMLNSDECCELPASEFDAEQSQISEAISEERVAYEERNCLICEKRFKQLSDLIRHMKDCKLDTLLTRQDCGKILESKQKLQVHKKFHAEHRLHVCQVCGKAYRYRSGLVIHSRKHTGLLPYLCDVCGAGFKDYFSLGQHKKRRHSSFRQFVCQTCGKGFVRNILLLRHLKSHSGVKQHVCPVCDMAFGYKGNLTRHLKTHAGEKPHRCETCGKTFGRLDHLRDHFRTHRGEQKNVCTDCKRIFKSAVMLKRHELIHLDKNLLSCNVCGKQFTAPIRLAQHLVIHQEKQYKCKICKRSFFFEHGFLRHIKKCHQ